MSRSLKRFAPLFALLGALLCLWGARTLVGARARPKRLRLAAGSHGNIALEAGAQLARIVQRVMPATRVEVLTTSGGEENLVRLESGTVELAIVHNTGAVWSDEPARVTILGPLYDEALHLVVRSDGKPAGWFDLAGLRVNIGPLGSGTHRVVTTLVARTKLTVVASTLSHEEAMHALLRGELDAFCVLAGVRSPAVEAALDSGKARLIPLAAAGGAESLVDGMRLALPSLQPMIIPAGSYGRHPASAVTTVGVRALWAAAASLPESVAWTLAKGLYENRRAAAESFPLFAHVPGEVEEAMLPYPLHPGAAQFYTRNQPPLILAWADTLSLFITLLLLASSGLLTLLRWRRQQRKFRVDRYYAELQALSRRLEAAASTSELQVLRHELLALRRRAIDDLMAGRLESNESFTIFQDYVRSELQEIDQRSRP